jgi:hypothetical protein
MSIVKRKILLIFIDIKIIWKYKFKLFRLIKNKIQYNREDIKSYIKKSKQ